MKTAAVTLTIISWIIGLFLDGNLGSGDFAGFINLRALFPILVMGWFILKSNEQNKNDK